MTILRCSVNKFPSLWLGTPAHVKLTLQSLGLVSICSRAFDDLALSLDLSFGDLFAWSRFGDFVFDLTIDILRVPEAFGPNSLDDFCSNQANKDRVQVTF